MTTVSTVLAVGLLGLSAGALLAEGAVLVPWWRSQKPADFLAWYPENEALLIRFFGPLEVLAFLTAAVAAAATWMATGSPPAGLLTSSVLALAVLAAFPLYFKAANTSFTEGTIAPDGLGAELARWARWHWARTVLATVAFLSAAWAATGIA